MHTFYLGVTMYLQERYDAAVEQFDRAISIYPNFADAEYYKAWSLDKLGQPAIALNLMTQTARDLEDGFTINDDNAAYERYPYQIKREWMKGAIASLREEINAQPAKSQ